MRPRGESISTPSSRYVGQAFRQRPQWTQRARSDCAGRSCAIESSETIVEAPMVKELLRVERLLDPGHDLQLRSRIGPQLELALDLVRTGFYHCVEAGRAGASQEIRQRVAAIDVSDTRAGPRQRG